MASSAGQANNFFYEILIVRGFGCVRAEIFLRRYGILAASVWKFDGVGTEMLTARCGCPGLLHGGTLAFLIKSYLCVVRQGFCPMNILFLNNQEVAPFTNGIQRITDTLARGFAGRGARCYSAYFSENEVCPKTEFAGKIRLDRAQVADGLGRFVCEHEIDVVICQQVDGGRVVELQVEAGVVRF